MLDSTTGFYYTLESDNTITINGWDISRGTDVVIPETLTVDGNNYSVIKVVGDDSETSFNKLTVDSLTISDSVTHLDISGLKINGDFTVPAGVKTFRCLSITCEDLYWNAVNCTYAPVKGTCYTRSTGYASPKWGTKITGFQGLVCDNFKIASSVTNFKTYVSFSYSGDALGCVSALGGMTVKDTLTFDGDVSFSYYDEYAASIYPFYVDEDVISATKLNKVVFSDTCTLTTVPDYLFAETELKEVVFNDNIVKLGEYAFYKCVDLSSVSGGSNIERIENRVFYSCSGLGACMTTWIPTLTKLGYLGSYALSDVSMTTLDLSTTCITTVGSYCFRNTGLTNLKLPVTVTSLGDCCLSGTTLTDINFNDLTSLKYIGKELFYGQTLLYDKEFIIPTSVEEIGYCAFKEVTAKITHPEVNNLSIVHGGAFQKAGTEDSIIYLGPALTNLVGDGPDVNSWSDEGWHFCDFAGIVDIDQAGAISNIWSSCFSRTRVTSFSDAWCASDLTLWYYAFLGTQFIESEGKDLNITGYWRTYTYYYNICSVFGKADLKYNSINFLGGCNLRKGTFGNSSSNRANLYGADMHFSDAITFGDSVFYCPDLEIGDVLIDNVTSWSSGGYIFRDSNIKSLTIINDTTTQVQNLYIPTGFCQDCADLITVNITGVSSVKEYAFNSCTALETIDIDATSIEKSFLRGSKSTCVLTLSDRLKTIGDEAFYGTTFGNMSDYEDLSIFPSLTTIDKSAFYGTTGFESMYIPDYITSIGASVFKNSSVTDVRWSSSVKTIDSETFSGCTKLKNVSNLQDVTRINSKAFLNCNNADGVSVDFTWEDINLLVEYAFQDSTVIFPDILNLESVTAIGISTFDGCSKLKDVIIGDNCLNVYDYAFRESSITNVHIGKSLTKLGYAPFGYCTELVKVTGGDSLTSLLGGSNYEDGVFYRCSALEVVDIPNAKLENIGKSCFSSCTSLHTFNFDDSVLTKIDVDAFYNTRSLKSLNKTLSALHTIDSSAFQDSAIEEFPWETAPLQIIGTEAFYRSNLSKVSIKPTVKSLGDSCFAETPLKVFRIEDGGVLTSLPTKMITSTVGFDEIYIGDSVKSLATGCISLTDNNVYKCELLEFSDDCLLTTINSDPIQMNVVTLKNLPLGVATLNYFMMNYGITDLTFDEDSTVTCIQNSFGRIENNIIIPETVTRITTTMSNDEYTKYIDKYSKPSDGAVWRYDYFYKCLNAMFNGESTDTSVYKKFGTQLTNKCFGYYGGTALDLSNVTYIGGTWNQAQADVIKQRAAQAAPAGIFIDCPNLTSLNIAEDIVELNGFYYVCSDLFVDLRNCTDLTHIVGFCNTTQLNGEEWLPETVTEIYGTWDDSIGTIYIPYGVSVWLGTTHTQTGVKNTYWIPKTVVDIIYLRGAGNYVVEEESRLGIPGQSLFKDCTYKAITNKNTGEYVQTATTVVSSSSAIVYFGDSDNYLEHTADIAMYEGYRYNTNYPLNYRYQVARRQTTMTVTTSKDESLGGIYVYANIESDLAAPDGHIVLTETDSEGNEREVNRLGSATKNVTFSILQENLPTGAVTYRCDFIPSATCYLRGTTAQVGYIASAEPVEITAFTVNTDDLTNGIIYIEGTIQGAKFPKGLMNFYLMTEDERLLISSQQVEILEGGATATAKRGTPVNIDGAYMRNGDNVYMCEFVSDNATAWYSAAPVTTTYTYTGSVPNLTLTTSVSGGGVNVIAGIETEALNSGVLTLYLGSDRFGEVLNLNGDLTATVSPDKLKTGVNNFYAVYESNSALWQSSTATASFDYNPAPTTLEFNTTETDDGVTLIVAPTNSLATGTINVYSGKDKNGKLLVSTTSGVVNQFISRNNQNIKDGVNEFFAEYIPDTVDWSYATATNSYLKTALNSRVTVSTMNYGDYVKLICRAYDSNDNLLNPEYLSIYLGATADGVLLNGSTIFDGATTRDCVEYNTTNMTAIATVPKSELFTGINEFYIEFNDPDSVYAKSSKYTTFEMDASGNPVIRNEGFTAEDVENLLTVLGQINNGQEINFTNLILALNKMTDTIDGDLKTIADYLQDLESGSGNTGTGGSNVDNTEVVEALKNIGDMLGTTWYLYKDADGNEYYAPNGGTDEKVVDSNGKEITKVVTESEMLQHLANTVESTGMRLSETVEEWLEAINKTVEDGFDEQNKLLDEIKNILGEDFAQYFDELSNAIKESSVSIDLDGLESLVSGGITDAQMYELIEAIRNGNTDKMDELIDAIKDVSIDVDTSGVEDKLDSLINTLEKGNNQNVVLDTGDLENVLGEINNNIKNQGTKSENNDELNDLIEGLIKELNENNKNTAGVTDEFLTDVLKTLEASINRGGDTDKELLGALERIATQLKNVNTTPEVVIDTSGLESLLREYYTPVDYNEIVNAIDRAVRNANNSNGNKNIANAIDGLTKAIQNGGINDEELASILERLDNLDKRLAEGLKIDGIERLDALISAVEKAANNNEIQLNAETMDLLKKLADNAEKGVWEQIPLPVKILLISFLVVGIFGFGVLSITGMYNIKKIKLEIGEIDNQIK